MITIAATETTTTTFVASVVAIVIMLKILELFVPRKKRSSRSRNRRNRNPSRSSMDRLLTITLVSIVFLAGVYKFNPRIVWFLAIAVLLATAAGISVAIVGSKKKKQGWESSSEIASTGPTSLTETMAEDQSAIVKGKEGEQLTFNALQELGENYRILGDVMLPAGNGETTQIDHVVVSEYGIFVIETKNYSGWIFASPKGRVWTQCLSTFGHSSEKHTFQNPLHQNYRHICALAENLGIPQEYFKSVVTFVGNAQFKTEIPAGVVFGHQLANYIKSFSTPIIKAKQLDEISDAIRQWEATLTEAERASHVETLKRKHSNNKFRAS